MNFGKTTKLLKERIGLSQEEMAEKLEISLSTYRRYEKNQVQDDKKNVLARNIAFKLANTFHLNSFKESIINNIKEEVCMGLNFELNNFVKNQKTDTIDELRQFIYILYSVSDNFDENISCKTEVKLLSNALINSLSKIIERLSPTRILEIGYNFNYGKFVKLISDKFSDMTLYAIGTQEISGLKANNVHFVKKENCFEEIDHIDNPDLILMLYSFHHITYEKNLNFYRIYIKKFEKMSIS